MILGRADGFAAKNGIARSAFDGLMMGIGFGLVLVVLGAARELLGTGTLFANMQLLFGPLAENWQLSLLGSDYKGFLLAILPPGAFLVLGLMIAGKNIVDQRAEARAKARQPAPEPVPSRRVRVTGVVE
ncbi:Electron transport complex subunit RsxE [compost metagenome]